ncbi:hypothetical protein GGX14DRAFT_398144 [Mycena pura]|uniref:Uncharacterized protein n=1 Tax=Mycena pura TaxID=153505 RepID=A0AAD6VEH3_9AGAR|nr:hypothetical protein GGX14DRAFT_398144 [Mycena pura]
MPKAKKKNTKRAEDLESDADEGPLKRGQPSDFKGQRLKFLQDNIPAYIEASKYNKSPESKKSKGTRAWFPIFFAQYWEKFPWRLPFDEDPPPAGPPAMLDTAEDGFTALDVNLTPEEEERKAATQKEIKGKIKRWFSRQRPTSMGMYGNPYFTWLSRLRRHEDEPPPKRPLDFQFYMRHPDYKEKVAERFQELYSDEPRAAHIALRCQVARELPAEESDEVRAQLKQECDDAHAEEMAVYEEGGDALPSVDPEVQKEARAKFMATVAPLLEGLRAYTGYTINLVTGAIEGDRFDVRSANTGLVGGKDWAQWDPTSYAEVLKKYANFVQAVHLESSGSSSSAPVTAAPPPAAPATAAPASGSAGSFFVGTNMLRMSEPPGPENDMESPARTGVEGGLPPLVEDQDDRDIEEGTLFPVPPARSPLYPSTSTAMPAPAPVPASTTPVPTPTPPAPAPTPAPSAPAPTPAPPAPAPTARPQPKPCWGLKNVTEPLREHVLSMEGENRKAYIRRLQLMSDYELNRENNIARNTALQRELGLLSTSAFFGMKKKRAQGDEGRGKKKKRSKKDEEVDGDEWSSDESQDDDSGEEERDDVERTPVRTRSKKTAKTVKASNGSRAEALGSEASGSVGDALGVAAPAWAKNAQLIWLTYCETYGLLPGEEMRSPRATALRP